MEISKRCLFLILLSMSAVNLLLIIKSILNSAREEINNSKGFYAIPQPNDEEYTAGLIKSPLIKIDGIFK